MSKDDKYFGAVGAGKFMWGKGLDVSDSDRSGIFRRSEKIVPKFAEGGSVGEESRGPEKFDNFSEMSRVKRREGAEMRDNRAEMHRIHERARDEQGRFAKGGPVKDGMFNNPKLQKGGLHESLGVPMGKKIGQKKIRKAEHSSNPLERKQAVLAENMMSHRKK